MKPRDWFSIIVQYIKSCQGVTLNKKGSSYVNVITSYDTAQVLRVFNGVTQCTACTQKLLLKVNLL